MRRLWCDRVLLEGCMMHCKLLLEKKKDRPNKKSLTPLFSPTSQTRSNAIRAREWAQATHGPQSPQCRAARAKVLESQAEAVALSAKYTAAMTAERKIGPGLNRLAMEVGVLREKEVLEEVARGRGRLRGGGGGRGRGGGRAGGGSRAAKLTSAM